MSDTTYVQEFNAVAEALNRYISGISNADSAVMKPAFSEHATMFGVKQGKLSGGAIDILFTNIDTQAEASPLAKAVIVNIDIVGTAASARVDSENVSGKFSYTDFFNLLKLDGNWIIVSKIFYTH